VVECLIPFFAFAPLARFLPVAMLFCFAHSFRPDRPRNDLNTCDKFSNNSFKPRNLHVGPALPDSETSCIRDRERQAPGRLRNRLGDRDPGIGRFPPEGGRCRLIRNVFHLLVQSERDGPLDAFDRRNLPLPVDADGEPAGSSVGWWPEAHIWQKFGGWFTLD